MEERNNYQCPTFKWVRGGNNTPLCCFNGYVMQLGSGIKLGAFTEERKRGQLCRLLGPVAGLGDNHATYIRSALQSALFMAQLYDQSSEVEIIGNVHSIKFSSVSPASWMIGFTIRSNKSPGYSVETVYPFRTSYSALSACQNVTGAFESQQLNNLFAILRGTRVLKNYSKMTLINYLTFYLTLGEIFYVTSGMDKIGTYILNFTSRQAIRSHID